MVCFLEDHKERIDIFIGHYPNAHIASTAYGMIAILEAAEEVKLLFLDHDLDDFGYIPGKINDTGMEVVMWIVGNKPKIERIIVHSRNGEVAPLMVQKLKEAGYNCESTPF